MNISNLNITISNFTGNNLYTFDSDLNGLRATCEINALNMFDRIQRTPEFSYYILAIAIGLITIYMFWIKVSSNIWIKENLKEEFILLPYLLLLTSLYIYSLTTFQTSTKETLNIIKYITYTLGAIILSKTLYEIYVKRFKK